MYFTQGEREKMGIAAHYYLIVTGELEKAAETYQEWSVSYQQDGARSDLGLVYDEQGLHEKAAEEFCEIVRVS
jgi:hypothetical protein